MTISAKMDRQGHKGYQRVETKNIAILVEKFKTHLYYTNHSNSARVKLQAPQGSLLPGMIQIMYNSQSDWLHSPVRQS